MRDGQLNHPLKRLRVRTHQIASDSKLLVQDVYAPVNLEVLPDGVVEQLERGFGPKQFRCICRADGSATQRWL